MLISKLERRGIPRSIIETLIQSGATEKTFLKVEQKM